MIKTGVPRPETQSSNGVEYDNLNLDSMVSFDIHPIQAHYNIVEMPYDSSLDTTHNGHNMPSVTPNKSRSNRQKNQNKNSQGGKAARISKLSSTSKQPNLSSLGNSVDKVDRENTSSSLY